MKRLLKWVGLGLAGLAGVAVLAVGGAFAASEMVVHKRLPKAPMTLAAATDAGAVARGARTARVYGCTNCHGADLTGRLFHDEPMIARIWAPNLTLAAAHQSDAELARAIRTGVAADGRALWVMPSAAFAHLSDAETADLIAYLRTFPARGAVQPAIQMGPVGRIGVLIGKFRSAPDELAAGEPSLPDFGPKHAEGRRLARACTECHGPALSGGDGAVKTPDLMIAAAYDRADFARLLRTGVAAGGRRVGLMSEVAPERFAGFSDEEIAALQNYLKARAEVAAAN